jgi:hypothetical protein
MLSTNGQLERLSWKSIYLRAVHARGLRATLPERPGADRRSMAMSFPAYIQSRVSHGGNAS